jgi:hypothetical protein
MKKNIAIFSALALLSTGTMYALFERDEREMFEDIMYPERNNREQDLWILSKGTDPNRYGPLSITQKITSKDHKDACRFMESDADMLHYAAYHKNRDNIANAIMCGHYHEKFVRAAAIYDDLPLWEHLIAYRENIKKIHNLDILTNVTSALWQAKSLEVVKLLVDKGRISIAKKYNGESFISHACEHDYPPNILAYGLEKHPQGVDAPDRDDDTPLFTLCSVGCGASTFLLSTALEKLELLKNAGANFLHKNNKAESVLMIVEDQIKSKQEYPKLITALSIFAARIKEITQEQQEQFAIKHATKIIQAKGQDCSLCLEPMNDDIQALDCLHTFHETCILQAVHAACKKCPICRANSMPKDENNKSGAHPRGILDDSDDDDGV